MIFQGIHCIGNMIGDCRDYTKVYDEIFLANHFFGGVARNDVLSLHHCIYSGGLIGTPPRLYSFVLSEHESRYRICNHLGLPIVTLDLCSPLVAVTNLSS